MSSLSLFWHTNMDPKKLRKQYMQCVPNLNKALQHVQSQLSDVPPSEFVLETNVKPYASAKRKMLQHNIKDPMRLNDLVRGRLYFSDQYEPKEVIELLKQIFGDKVKKTDKKDTNDCGLEYAGVTDVSLDIDGVPFELQLMPMGFRSHQGLSHQIHEKLRSDKGKLTDKQKEFLRQTHNKLFRALDAKSKAPKED